MYQEVREAAMREYVSRVCAAVLSSEALAALGPDVPALLAAQLRASAIVTRYVSMCVYICYL